MFLYELLITVTLWGQIISVLLADITSWHHQLSPTDQQFLKKRDDELSDQIRWHVDPIKSLRWVLIETSRFGLSVRWLLGISQWNQQRNRWKCRCLKLLLPPPSWSFLLCFWMSAKPELNYQIWHTLEGHVTFWLLLTWTDTSSFLVTWRGRILQPCYLSGNSTPSPVD